MPSSTGATSTWRRPPPHDRTRPPDPVARRRRSHRRPPRRPQGRRRRAGAARRPRLPDVPRRRALAGCGPWTASASTKALVAEDGGEVVGPGGGALVRAPGEAGPVRAAAGAGGRPRLPRNRRGTEAGRGGGGRGAKRTGCLGIEVTTGVQRGEAQTFYEGIGFETGESRYYRKALLTPRLLRGGRSAGRRRPRPGCRSSRGSTSRPRRSTFGGRGRAAGVPEADGDVCADQAEAGHVAAAEAARPPACPRGLTGGLAGAGAAAVAARAGTAGTPPRRAGSRRGRLGRGHGFAEGGQGDRGARLPPGRVGEVRRPASTPTPSRITEATSRVRNVLVPAATTRALIRSLTCVGFGAGTPNLERFPRFPGGIRGGVLSASAARTPRSRRGGLHSAGPSRRARARTAPSNRAARPRRLISS